MRVCSNYYDDISLVKGAINAADYVTTVSPNYANELQFSFYAHGLEGVIAANRGKLRGILNGIDMKANDPSTRKDLAARFHQSEPQGQSQMQGRTSGATWAEGGPQCSHYRLYLPARGAQGL